MFILVGQLMHPKNSLQIGTNICILLIFSPPPPLILVSCCSFIWSIFQNGYPVGTVAWPQIDRMWYTFIGLLIMATESTNGNNALRRKKMVGIHSERQQYWKANQKKEETKKIQWEKPVHFVTKKKHGARSWWRKMYPLMLIGWLARWVARCVARCAAWALAVADWPYYIAWATPKMQSVWPERSFRNHRGTVTPPHWQQEKNYHVI